MHPNASKEPYGSKTGDPFRPRNWRTAAGTDPVALWRAYGPLAEQLAQKGPLAESWWGGELQRPAFRKVATWMLTTGTWMIVSHFLWRSRLRKKGAWLRVRQVLAATSSLLVAGLTQLGVLVLMVLALIPVKKLREVLSGILLRVTGVLGDSYIFVENRIQQAAIITKANEDLHWLASRCERG